MLLERARFPIALIASVAFTAALFVLMQGLIVTGKSTIEDQLGSFAPRFIRIKRGEDVKTVERKAERPPAPDRPPAPPSAPQAQTAQAVTQALSIGDVAVDVDLAVSSGLDGGTGTDGEYLPIVKVAPIYPPRAMQRGLQGWVLVEFTVTASGTVRDAVAVDADPKNVFEEAAIDAAQKFRYKPRVVAGKAVDVSGVQNVIRFELEK
ncbi:MAG: energy transducer TonB [Panacagrimonas sp.]